jgi:hypothetical protein
MYPPLCQISSKGMCNATAIVCEMTLNFDRGLIHNKGLHSHFNVPQCEIRRFFAS